MVSHLRIIMIIIPVIATAVLAETWGDQFFDLIRWGIFYAFLTPVGWALLFVFVFGVLKFIGSTIKTVLTTDYSEKMTEEEKREELLNMLMRCSEKDMD